MQTSTLTAEVQEGIDRAIKHYYGHRPDDVDEARQIIVEAIHAGRVATDVYPRDIVNIVLLGDRDEAYLAVRALALEVLRNPERIGTTSNGERLACALMFGHADWLGTYSWAEAARRVGPEWLRAIVLAENDFRWLRPPIVLAAELGKSEPSCRVSGTSRGVS